MRRTHLCILCLALLVCSGHCAIITFSCAAEHDEACIISSQPLVVQGGLRYVFGSLQLSSSASPVAMWIGEVDAHFCGTRMPKRGDDRIFIESCNTGGRKTLLADDGSAGVDVPRGGCFALCAQDAQQMIHASERPFFSEGILPIVVPNRAPPGEPVLFTLISTQRSSSWPHIALANSELCRGKLFGITATQSCESCDLPIGSKENAVLLKATRDIVIPRSGTFFLCAKVAQGTRFFLIGKVFGTGIFSYDVQESFVFPGTPFQVILRGLSIFKKPLLTLSSNTECTNCGTKSEIIASHKVSDEEWKIVMQLDENAPTKSFWLCVDGAVLHRNVYDSHHMTAHLPQSVVLLSQEGKPTISITDCSPKHLGIRFFPRLPPIRNFGSSSLAKDDVCLEDLTICTNLLDVKNDTVGFLWKPLFPSGQESQLLVLRRGTKIFHLRNQVQLSHVLSLHVPSQTEHGVPFGTVLHITVTGIGLDENDDIDLRCNGCSASEVQFSVIGKSVLQNGRRSSIRLLVFDAPLLQRNGTATSLSFVYIVGGVVSGCQENAFQLDSIAFFPPSAEALLTAPVFGFSFAMPIKVLRALLPVQSATVTAQLTLQGLLGHSPRQCSRMETALNDTTISGTVPGAIEPGYYKVYLDCPMLQPMRLCVGVFRVGGFIPQTVSNNVVVVSHPQHRVAVKGKLVVFGPNLPILILVCREGKYNESSCFHIATAKINVLRAVSSVCYMELEISAVIRGESLILRGYNQLYTVAAAHDAPCQSTHCFWPFYGVDQKGESQQQRIQVESAPRVVIEGAAEKTGFDTNATVLWARSVIIVHFPRLIVDRSQIGIGVPSCLRSIVEPNSVTLNENNSATLNVPFAVEDPHASLCLLGTEQSDWVEVISLFIVGRAQAPETQICCGNIVRLLNVPPNVPLMITELVNQCTVDYPVVLPTSSNENVSVLMLPNVGWFCVGVPSEADHHSWIWMKVAPSRERDLVKLSIGGNAYTTIPKILVLSRYPIEVEWPLSNRSAYYVSLSDVRLGDSFVKFCNLTQPVREKIGSIILPAPGLHALCFCTEKYDLPCTLYFFRGEGFSRVIVEQSLHAIQIEDGSLPRQAISFAFLAVGGSDCGNAQLQRFYSRIVKSSETHWYFKFPSISGVMNTYLFCVQYNETYLHNQTILLPPLGDETMGLQMSLVRDFENVTLATKLWLGLSPTDSTQRHMIAWLGNADIVAKELHREQVELFTAEFDMMIIPLNGTRLKHPNFRMCPPTLEARFLALKAARHFMDILSHHESSIGKSQSQSWLLVVPPGRSAVCVHQNGFVDFFGTISLPGPELVFNPAITSRNDSIFRTEPCSSLKLTFRIAERTTAATLTSGLFFSLFSWNSSNLCASPSTAARLSRQKPFYEEKLDDKEQLRLATFSAYFESNGTFVLCYELPKEIPPISPEQRQSFRRLRSMLKQYKLWDSSPQPVVAVGVEKDKKLVPLIVTVTAPTLLLSHQRVLTVHEGGKRFEMTELILTSPHLCSVKRWHVEGPENNIPVDVVKERENVFRATMFSTLLYGRTSNLVAEIATGHISVPISLSEISSVIEEEKAVEQKLEGARDEGEDMLILLPQNRMQGADALTSQSKMASSLLGAGFVFVAFFLFIRAKRVSVPPRMLSTVAPSALSKRSPCGMMPGAEFAVLHRSISITCNSQTITKGTAKCHVVVFSTLFARADEAECMLSTASRRWTLQVPLRLAIVEPLGVVDCPPNSPLLIYPKAAFTASLTGWLAEEFRKPFAQRSALPASPPLRVLRLGVRLSHVVQLGQFFVSPSRVVMQENHEYILIADKAPEFTLESKFCLRIGIIMMWLLRSWFSMEFVLDSSGRQGVDIETQIDNAFEWCVQHPHDLNVQEFAQEVESQGETSFSCVIQLMARCVTGRIVNVQSFRNFVLSHAQLQEAETGSFGVSSEESYFSEL